MSSIGYTTGVPNPTNPPNRDVSSMQTNTNNINTYVGVDHIPFNSTLGGKGNGGWHNIIHLPRNTKPAAQASPPAGQLYAKLAVGDTQLFYESSGGVETQLTGAGGQALTSATGSISLTSSFQTVLTLPANCIGYIYFNSTSGNNMINFWSVSSILFANIVVNAATNYNFQIQISGLNLQIKVTNSIPLNFNYKYIYWSV
jgi:hypothetical protein